MNYDAVIATAVNSIRSVREFGDLFPNAEHTLVKGKRDYAPEGWQIVYEWVSRSHLHDRYVFWLVVAIEVRPDGSVAELERPSFYVVEFEKTERGDENGEGRSWQFSVGEFEEGDWEQFVASGGDFAAIGLELNTDAAVDQFAMCWQDTRPPRLAEPGDGMAFKAPLRFMMQQ